MTREKHKIYCRKCHGRYKVIKLDKLKEMDSTKKQEIETICEECKLVPLWYADELRVQEFEDFIASDLL